MRFLSLFTPVAPMSGPPSQEDMTRMGQLVEDGMRRGVLVSTGGMKKREAGGFIVSRKDGVFDINTSPQTPWMRAAGYAILETKSRDEAIVEVKKFLDLVGDGASEIIELSEPPQR